MATLASFVANLMRLRSARLVVQHEEPIGAFKAVSRRFFLVDCITACNNSQSAELLSVRKRVTASLPRHRPYKNDIAVRVSDVPAFLKEVGALFAE